MAAVKTNDGMRSLSVVRGQIGGEATVFVQVTSEKLIPGFQLLTFSVEAWDELVAGAK